MHAQRLSVPFAIALAWLSIGPARATLITVDSTFGGYDANSCTMLDAFYAATRREATGTCPAGTGADQIILPAAATITLTEPAPGAPRSAFPMIDSQIVLLGNGSTVTTNFDHCTIGSNEPFFRFFIIVFDGSLELHDLSLTGGCIAQSSEDGGGAILAVNGNLVLANVNLAGNTSADFGGAVRSEYASITVVNSTVTGNRSGNDDGGGGIYSFGEVDVSNSYFADNIGGALSGDVVDVVNSTFHANTRGAAIHVFSAAAISFSTFVGNTWQTIYADGTSVLANNLIIQAPGGGPSPVCVASPFGATFVSVGANISDDTSCGAVDVISRSDARVAQPGNYGGFVPTIAMHNGSAAIDAASCSDASGAQVFTDARGTPRPYGTACDAGAFEYDGADLGEIARTWLHPYDILVSTGWRVIEYDRSGAYVQEFWPSWNPPMNGFAACGLEAVGVAGFGAFVAAYPDALVGQYFSSEDDWTFFASAPGRSTRYCGTVAHWGQRWFATPGGYGIFQDRYGVTIYEPGGVNRTLADDLYIEDVSIGKDGRLYLLGIVLATNDGFVVRSYDPQSLQQIGQIPVLPGADFAFGRSVAVAANGDVYVALYGPLIYRYDRSGQLLQQTDCVVPGNAYPCGAVVSLRFADDGILFVGATGGRLTALQPDFSSGSSFAVDIDPYFGFYLAPVALDGIFAGSFDP
jgi:hypothetical protein